jgi:hypothetical protein
LSVFMTKFDFIEELKKFLEEWKWRFES